MKVVALINPNTSTATTTMMAAVAETWLAPAGLGVAGLTAEKGPAMITDPSALPVAAAQVETLGVEAFRSTPDLAGIVVAAFADPGAAALAARVPVPVVGIGGASIRAAATAGRRFGIATVAPALVPAMVERIWADGLGDQLTGVRAVDLSPPVDPDALTDAMHALARQCVEEDGAEAVIIGGGPLGAAAEILRDRLGVELVSPIAAACLEIAGS